MNSKATCIINNLPTRPAIYACTKKFTPLFNPNSKCGKLIFKSKQKKIGQPLHKFLGFDLHTIIVASSSPSSKLTEHRLSQLININEIRSSSVTLQIQTL